MHEELNWFASFPEELKKFRGKHVAIIGKEVVASGESAKEVLEAAMSKYPSTMPVLTFIPKKDILVL